MGHKYKIILAPMSITYLKGTTSLCLLSVRALENKLTIINSVTNVYSNSSNIMNAKS